MVKIRYTKQIVAGLVYIHSRSVVSNNKDEMNCLKSYFISQVHRDLKGANVFVTTEGIIICQYRKKAVLKMTISRCLQTW